MRPLPRLTRFLALCAIMPCALITTAHAKGPKIHSAAVGKPHPVFWSTAEAPAIRLSLNIRPLIVDGRRKAWVFGDAHDVTDHTFVALEVQHINDALPGDKLPHYIWQTASWLLVERNTGHVSSVHFTGYDPALSGISWFRDYAAFCSLNASGKILFAEVVQLGSRKPAAHKKLGSWPLPALPAPPDAPVVTPEVVDSAAHSPDTATTAPAATAENPKPAATLKPALHPHTVHPVITPAVNTGAPKPAVCTTDQWDRDPLRVTLTPRADLPAVTLELAIDLSAPAPTPIAASE